MVTIGTASTKSYFYNMLLHLRRQSQNTFIQSKKDLSFTQKVSIKDFSEMNKKGKFYKEGKKDFYGSCQKLHFAILFKMVGKAKNRNLSGKCENWKLLRGLNGANR